MYHKKKRGAEAPLYFNPASENSTLVIQLSLMLLRLPASREDQCQVAHGQVARAEIADEREAVSELELANGDHIALEPQLRAETRST